MHREVFGHQGIIRLGRSGGKNGVALVVSQQAGGIGGDRQTHAHGLVQHVGYHHRYGYRNVLVPGGAGDWPRAIHRDRAAAADGRLGQAAGSVGETRGAGNLGNTAEQIGDHQGRR